MTLTIQVIVNRNYNKISIPIQYDYFIGSSNMKLSHILLDIRPPLYKNSCARTCILYFE